MKPSDSMVDGECTERRPRRPRDRLAEVEEAQQGIVRVAKELEAEGTIVLGGKGKEDVLV